jgi:hypothetical protein
MVCEGAFRQRREVGEDRLALSRLQHEAPGAGQHRERSGQSSHVARQYSRAHVIDEQGQSARAPDARGRQNEKTIHAQPATRRNTDLHLGGSHRAAINADRSYPVGIERSQAYAAVDEGCDVRSGEGQRGERTVADLALDLEAALVVAVVAPGEADFGTGRL